MSINLSAIRSVEIGDGPEARSARLPNFFIVGAPKCGTTSMAAWLGQHPNVFMPGMKEPHFFNADDRQEVNTLAEYEALFSDARDQHRARGEGSVWYLYSSVAVRNILTYNPEARFIVMLRNPVDMAPALHAEMLLSGHENVGDFRTAWDLQADRRQGRRLPALTWAGRRLLYGDACALGAQLERLFSIVPRHRVLTILLDDLAANPLGQYLRALRFLGLEDDGRAEFPIYNSRRSLRWPHLNRGMFVISQMKSRIGIKLKMNLWSRVANVNVIEAPRGVLDTETAAILRSYFAKDVALMDQLLGIDLGHWLGT